MTRRSLLLGLTLLGALVLTLAGDSVRADRQANLFEVATGFAAKESCSCAFVAGQTDEYCQAFGQIEGVTMEIAIDRLAQTVTATFSGISRTARATAGAGCSLDPLNQ